MFYRQISRMSARSLCRIAINLAVLLSCAACASPRIAHEQWAAHGYLSPGPTGDPEIIGLFERESDCQEAADAWMSRQVVGNPVFAECYPADRN